MTSGLGVQRPPPVPWAPPSPRPPFDGEASPLEALILAASGLGWLWAPKVPRRRNRSRSVGALALEGSSGWLDFALPIGKPGPPVDGPVGGWMGFCFCLMRITNWKITVSGGPLAVPSPGPVTGCSDHRSSIESPIDSISES
jgi:hypothetical protein